MTPAPKMRRMRHFVGLLVLVACLSVPVAALGEGSPPPAAVAACQAEAKALGTDAFVAKYGPTEPWGHCFAAHATAATTTTTTTTTSTTTTTGDGHRSPTAAAVLACQAVAKSLGRTAFAAKFGGHEAMGNCVRAALAKTGRHTSP